jgi:type I site-specific restriction endonuclease
LTTSNEIFRSSLAKLLAKFQADQDHYLSKAYSEAQARIDFITPFFKALGWDVENEAGLPHHHREVIVERGESETTGRPDYNFRISGQTKFFVEAKAPSEPLDSTRHILQAKGYAWNTRQVSFVILTDFEEFRFYDASVKPDERKPGGGPRTAQLGRPSTDGRRAPTAAGEDTGATELEREIASTDAEIDELVYELYGITDKERKIIES